MHATLTVLGSGTSMGVPTIGCDCAVCTSTDPHDRRTRPSIMLEYNDAVVLIDTGPDFREQALREKIKRVDAVLYTHGHADHILGLDDLRPLSFKHGNGLPLYASESAAQTIEQVFKYAFDSESTYATRPRVRIEPLHSELDLFGVRFITVPLLHGDHEVAGFRFGEAAYLTDFSSIPENSMALLHDLDILFLDALRRKPHPTHSNLDNSLRLVEELKPRRAFFTHMSHDLKHEETNAALPPDVRLSHDGLKLEFEIA
ncbi:MAG: MBL fold metallo-hydrolase [Acidobacteriaceae bacterium]